MVAELLRRIVLIPGENPWASESVRSASQVLMIAAFVLLRIGGTDRLSSTLVQNQDGFRAESRAICTVEIPGCSQGREPRWRREANHADEPTGPLTCGRGCPTYGSRDRWLG